jgi:ribosomal protein S18 acetylase RimI-like enzyme
MADGAASDAPFDEKRGAVLTAVPVGRVSRAGFQRALALEAQEWLERLDWDFSEIAVMIAEAVTHGVLRGVALVDGREPVAFAIYTTESRRSLIGEIFVAAPYRSEATNRALVTAFLKHMPRSHARKRIESQSIVFDARGMADAFGAAGFTTLQRSFMVADASEARPASTLQSNGRIVIRSWLDSDYGRAADLIYLSYKGTADIAINSGYRTREGCADLLDALTDSVWCGQFDPAVTQVAVDVTTGRPCGVAIASRVSPVAVHVGQISVLPAYQGRGVGRALVDGVLAGTRLAGLRRVNLAVTLSNERAVHLYQSCGFRSVLEFPVFFRTGPGSRDPDPGIRTPH